MPSAIFPFDPETLVLDTKAAAEIGRKFHSEYADRDPYPHICFDNACPAEVLDRVRAEFGERGLAEKSFARAQENRKYSYTPERLSPYTRAFLHALNSRGFLAFLENLTGIEGLIPDPYYAGGGIHEVANGGHLDIHADFNHHGKLDLERRINVLIYLNKDWQEAWGGSFEIWDKQMAAKLHSFIPLFNRMVIFSTGSDTYHGNPEVVAHPSDESRLSIALYYYTATWDDTRVGHT
ncbi:MAG TPA: 2OG-Fe(II) oxygenase, partial [Thermohalobaculum sp.]|nr:2OG-Fe(II) oxygenase [Thermohalobaculum sp.]